MRLRVFIVNCSFKPNLLITLVMFVLFVGVLLNFWFYAQVVNLHDDFLILIFFKFKLPSKICAND